MIKYLILFFIILVLIYFILNLDIIKLPLSLSYNVEKFGENECYVKNQSNINVTMKQCKIYYADDRDTCDSYPELYKLTILQLDILLTLVNVDNAVQYKDKSYDSVLIQKVKTDKLNKNIKDSCGFTPDRLYEIEGIKASDGTVQNVTYEGKSQYGCFLPLEGTDITGGDINDSIINRYGELNMSCIDSANKTPVTNIKCEGTNCPKSNDFHVITNFDNIENTYDITIPAGEIFLKIFDRSRVGFVKYNKSGNILEIATDIEVKRKFDSLYEIKYKNPLETFKYPKEDLTASTNTYSNGIAISVYASSGSDAYNVFNTGTAGWNTTNTVNNEYFAGYSGEFLKFDLGEDIVLKSFKLHPNSGNTNKAPKNYRIYGTNEQDKYDILGDVVKIKENNVFRLPTNIKDNDYYYAFTSTSGTNSIEFTEDTVCDILVVGGGGGGGQFGGGGGAGGLVFGNNIVLLRGIYNINVGDGGNGATVRGGANGINGLKTTFVGNGINIEANGGGGGGTRDKSAIGVAGKTGGSGGGGSHSNRGGSAKGGETNQKTYRDSDIALLKSNIIATTSPIQVRNNHNYYYYAFTNTTGTNRIEFKQATVCEILVVGGGGGGGGSIGGGGGGGAVVHIPRASLNAGTYNIQVGDGGNSSANASSNGKNSTITLQGSTIKIIAEGGGGVTYGHDSGVGKKGGSGGGGSGGNSRALAGGATGGVSSTNIFTGVIYGNKGGGHTNGRSGSITNAAGGGGAGSAAATIPTSSRNIVGHGGDGIQINIDGNNNYWGGGGAGGMHMANAANGGKGGGGGGGGNGIGGGNSLNSGSNGNNVNGGTGGRNTGGGGGGGQWHHHPGGKGGSGIVIIRVPINKEFISSGWTGYGNNGGRGRPNTSGGNPDHASGGGGGAGSSGFDYSNTIGGGNGGKGKDFSTYFSTSVGDNGWFAGGGGGNTYWGGGTPGFGNGGNGLKGGGGNGGFDGSVPGYNENSAQNGRAGTGGGGGGSKWDGSGYNGGKGGSGVVIIHFKKSKSSAGWTQIYQHSPIGETGPTTSYKSTLSNILPFRYYAMVVKNNWQGINGSSISQLELFGYSQQRTETRVIEPPAIYATPTSTTKDAYLFIFDKNNKIKEFETNKIANFSLKDNFKIATKDIFDKKLNTDSDSPAYGKISRLISKYINSKNNDNMTLNLTDIDAKITEYNADNVNLGNTIQLLSKYKQTIFNDINISGMTFEQYDEYTKLYNNNFYLSNDDNIYIKI